MYDAIRTHYRGPTDTKGSHIKARSGGDSITVGYQSALDTPQNHRRAARALLERHFSNDENWILLGGSLENDGYVFIPIRAQAVFLGALEKQADGLCMDVAPERAQVAQLLAHALEAA